MVKMKKGNIYLPLQGRMPIDLYENNWHLIEV